MSKIFRGKLALAERKLSSNDTLTFSQILTCSCTLVKMRACKKKMNRVQHPQNTIKAVKMDTIGQVETLNLDIFRADSVQGNMTRHPKKVFLYQTLVKRVKTWICLVCHGPYSTPKSDWVQCFMYDNWARRWFQRSVLSL